MAMKKKTLIVGAAGAGLLAWLLLRKKSSGVKRMTINTAALQSAIAAKKAAQPTSGLGDSSLSGHVFKTKNGRRLGSLS